jgi:mono/diheme cytochrome c family protein
MPNLLRGDAGKAEALTHYLLSKSPPAPQAAFPDKSAAARGESLYHRVGCVACHDPQNGSALPADSVPLPRMEEKWTFDGLRKFLMDPQATRPPGRMPSLNLTSAEAADIAHYLLKGTKVPAAVEASFYSARFQSLEDLDQTETSRTAPAPGLTSGAPLLEGGSAVRLTTWVNVGTTGRYRFFLTASSASRLAINGAWVMGEDTWESPQVAENHALDLKAGSHELKVDFVKRGKKEPSLTVEWEGPGIPRSPVPANLLSSEKEPAAPLTEFKPDPAKAEQGRAIYAAMNCASCHETKPSTPGPARPRRPDFRQRLPLRKPSRPVAALSIQRHPAGRAVGSPRHLDRHPASRADAAAGPVPYPDAFPLHPVPRPRWPGRSARRPRRILHLQCRRRRR